MISCVVVLNSPTVVVSIIHHMKNSIKILLIIWQKKQEEIRKNTEENQTHLNQMA